MVLGMKQQRSPNTYTPKERNLYLTGLLGQNMIYNIIGTGLVFYFQSVLFIPAMATGVIFAIARVWDAINDPMMGTIVDRTNTKYEIYHAVKNEIGKSRNWQQLQERLAEKGITIRFKYTGQTSEIQGVSFSKGEYTFKGSEIGRAHV